VWNALHALCSSVVAPEPWPPWPEPVCTVLKTRFGSRPTNSRMSSSPPAGQVIALLSNQIAGQVPLPQGSFARISK
jgi:hypothetical protein